MERTTLFLVRSAVIAAGGSFSFVFLQMYFLRQEARFHSEKVFAGSVLVAGVLIALMALGKLRAALTRRRIA
jgi:hypothetical protein